MILKGNKHENEIMRSLAVLVVMFAIASLAVKALHGLDQDEQAIYCIMQRFLQGDRWLIDLYDPRQFAALIGMPFFWFSAFVCPKNPVLAFRVISILVSVFISRYLYKFIKQETKSKSISLLCVLCWLTITPKFIIALDHSHLFYIFSTLYIVHLYKAYKCSNKSEVYIVGAIFCGMVLCYPSMVVLFIPTAIILVLTCGWRSIIKYLSTCIVIASFFLIPCILSIGITGLKESIKMVLMDGTHDIGKSLSEKFFFEIDLWKAAGKYILIYIGACIIDYFISKKRDSYYARLIALLFPFIRITILCVSGVKMYPFEEIFRYLVLLIILMIESVRKKNWEMMICSIAPALFFIIAWKSTNNGMISSCGYLVTSAVLLIVFLHNSNHKVAMVVAVVVLLSQCGINAINYRASGTPPTSLYSMDLVENDSYLYGLRIEESTDKILSNIDYISQMLDSENIVFIGKDIYATRLLGKNYYMPVTTASISIDQQWERYFISNPSDNFDVLIEGTEGMENVEFNKLQMIVEKLHYNIQECETGDGFSIIHYVKER